MPDVQTAGPETHRLHGLARGSTLNLVGGGAGALLTLGMMVALARSLGEDGSGAFFAAIALFQVVIVAAGLGVETGLVRTVSGRASAPTGTTLGRLLMLALTPVIVLSALLTAAGWASASWLGTLLGDGAFGEVIAGYIRSLVPFLTPGAVFLAILGATRGFGTMTPTVVLERTGRPALQLALVLMAVAAGMAGAMLATLWAVPYVAGVVAAAIWLARLDRGEREPPHIRPLRDVAREFWSFTLPRGIASLFRVSLQWFDVVLVAALATPAATALYTVATRLLQFGMLAVFGIGQAVEPRFGAALAAGDREQTLDLYRVSTAWLILLTWPLYVLITVFAPTFLGLFGPGFAEASPVLVILVVGVLVGSGVGAVDVLLLMAGKSTWSLINTGVALVLTVGLNLLLVPTLGIAGAAIAWTTGRLAANLLPLLQVSRRFGFSPYGPAWLAAAGLAVGWFAGVGVPARVLLGSEPWVLAGVCLVAAAGYVIALHRRRDLFELPVLAAILRRGAR